MTHSEMVSTLQDAFTRVTTVHKALGDQLGHLQLITPRSLAVSQARKVLEASCNSICHALTRLRALEEMDRMDVIAAPRDSESSVAPTNCSCYPSTPRVYVCTDPNCPAHGERNRQIDSK